MCAVAYTDGYRCCLAWRCVLQNRGEVIDSGSGRGFMDGGRLLRVGIRQQRLQGNHAQQAHFQRHTCIRLVGQVLPGVAANLIPQLHEFDRQACGQRMQFSGDFTRIALGVEANDGNFLDLLQEAQQQVGVVRCVFVQCIKDLSQSGGIAIRQHVQHLVELRFGHGTEQGGNIAAAHFTLTIGERLVEQAKAVAHAASSGIG